MSKEALIRRTRAKRVLPDGASEHVLSEEIQVQVESLTVGDVLAFAEALRIADAPLDRLIEVKHVGELSKPYLSCSWRVLTKPPPPAEPAREM